ncbi:MAG: hypothetical protein RBS80_25835 [Thermoguttaceae bacterium]|nr:hypothetical protein [Thermoguttaceae bacterium]
MIKKIGGALQAISKKCALEHEDSHAGDMPDAACEGRPDGGFPKCPEDWDQDKSECSALATSLQCLRGSKKDCQGDKQCEWGVDVWVENQESQMKALDCEKKYKTETP